MELTTVETLAELKKTGIKEDETYRKLRTVLTGADLVKFAIIADLTDFSYRREKEAEAKT